MRIRIWNAYASNNSGSYTIVGRFDSDESAARVAAEILELVRAQSAWASGNGSAPSPLGAFAKQHGLKSHQSPATDTEWPEYSQQEHPDVWSVGSQVFLYSDYQVTMTPVFGELIYARGGRVEYEADHAHHPMAALFEIWWPWKDKTPEKTAAGTERVLRALHEDPLFYDNCADGAPYHTWRQSDDWDTADLRIGAKFANLVGGFTAVDRAVRDAGASVNVRVFESLSPGGDDFAFLRPPLPQVELH